MEAKHTPGPWKATVEGTNSGRWYSITADDFEYDDGSPHELFRSETVETNLVSRGRAWTDVQHADEIRANVTLATAAPALLAACEALLQQHCTPACPRLASGECIMPSHIEAKTAIAAALPSQPVDELEARQ